MNSFASQIHPGELAATLRQARPTVIVVPPHHAPTLLEACRVWGQAPPTLVSLGGRVPGENANAEDILDDSSLEILPPIPVSNNKYS